MSGSNWGYKSGLTVIAIISIAIWTVLVVELTKRKTENDIKTNHDASHYTKHTKSQIQSLCSGIESKSLAIDCAVTEYETSRDAERGENDLGAQQSMSEWAYLMVLVSGATTIITAIGAFFVWGTLRETRTIGQAQTRAYISVSATRVEHDANEGAFFIKVPIKNTGQTPARKIRATWQISCANEWKHFPMPTDDGISHTLGSGLEMPHEFWTNGKTNSEDRLHQSIYQRVHDGELTLWLWVFARYDDVFDISHETITCLRLVFTNNEWKLIVHDKGNHHT